MPSEAAWHPAFMPNSAADIIQKKAIPASDPVLAPEPPAESAKPVLPPLTSNLDTQSPPPDGVLENGTLEDENNEGHPELGNLRSALTTSLASPGGVELDEPPFQDGLSQEQITQDKADFPSAGPTSGSKHVSTMSFARTVSEEVVLGEDDEVDPEWNLHRTDTDPFKLMAKSDRTNSFPQVPPAHSPATFSEVPSNQAEDIINEVEQEPRDLFSDDEHGGDADFFAQTAAQGTSREESNSFPSSFDQTFGSEVQGEEDQDSQARYEEGLPLVERSDTNQQPQAVHAAFDDDGEDGEDFFTQVGKAEPPTDTRPALERKSTSQVLNSFNFQPAEHIQPAVSEEPEFKAIEGEQEAEKPTTNSTALDALLAEETEEAATFEIKPAEGDLAEKWQAALDDDEFLDDDELLPDDEPTEDKTLDPADIFGSDDEGFLEDTEEDAQAASQPAAPKGTQVNGHASQSGSGSSRYLPTDLPTTSAQPINSYAPSAPQFTDLSQSAAPGIAPMPYGAPPPAAFPGQLVQPQRPELPKAESFANKNKGGYASPYDLPMEVVKPRKRPSLQQMNRGYSNQFGGPSPLSPPRSASAYTQQPPPSRGSASSLSPPTTGYGQQASLQYPPSATGQAPPPSLKPKASSNNFFEDLPVSSRPKPARQSTLPNPPVSHAPPAVPPPPPTAGHVPPPPAASYAPPPPAAGYAAPPQQPPQAAAYPSQGLVAPERVSPYASLPSQQAAVPAAASRYSPAPAQQQAQTAPPPPNSQSRYSPALARGGPAAAPAPVLPHLPRTSSPLAHFERSPDSGTSSTHSQTASFDRRSSSSYESNLRPHHLPPTREVDEGEEANSPAATKPVSHTPPPPQTYATKPGQSPPRRTGSAYLPQQARHVTPPHTLVPPKRSQTQSPGTAYTGKPPAAPLDPYQRPASTEVPYPPRVGPGQPQTQSRPSGRPRGLSTGFNYILPTDGQEHDPLQRWKGAPVFCWGVGGTFITSFPKDVPRYMNQTPMTIRTPGEVKVRNIKDIDPLPERLSRFPGPLKGKSKKKEVIAWLNSGIQILEQNASHLRTSFALTHDDKRTEERILLWKILTVFIENDGILEGNPTVDAAVRAVLSPGLVNNGDGAPMYTTGADLSGITASKGGAVSDPVDPAAIDELRKFLLKGDREKAVWEAVDKRLWGHAMLISNTVSKDLFRQVAQEFVQKEVRSAGENTESLAALYEVFAGNFEESIDELVPPSARAGFQLVSTSDTAGPSKDALHGLDRWRETLGLVLSNRSVDDNKALNALGKLLSGYGRAEAGHICFLFARSHSIFGGIGDPASNVVLVGSDHIRQPHEFDKEMEPILLTEVFEYGLSLANTANVAILTSHLSVYKLQHARILAEYGYREQALQYCESIASAITSQTRRSPYHHKWLVAELDDFSQRLKQSPKDEKASWVSKPSIDKVSSSVWSTFNKFVAGDEVESGTPGSATGSSAAEHGPFARLAGGTPTISRAPSAVDLYGSYSGGMPINGAAATKAGARYAPGAALDPQNASYQSAPMYGSQPKSSFEDMQSSQYQPSYPSSYPEPGKLDPNLGRASPPTYAPQNGPGYSAGSPYTPANVESPMGGQPRTPYTPTSALTAGLAAAQPAASQAPTSYEPSVPTYEPPSSSYEPPSAGYQPPASSYETPSSGYEPPTNGYEPPTNGYEPPSGGYEPPTTAYQPPSYEPATMDDEPVSDEPVPKKKSFMGGDDDIPAAPAASREKTKAEKDREADEAFRKAAEADAARAKEVVPKKSGWGLSGWFSAGAKKEPADAVSQPNKPIRAKLGEASSFVYDPDLKRWVNKKAGAEDTPVAAATPPPPKATGPRRAVSGAPPSGPPGPTSAPRPMSAAGPPPSRSLSGPGPEANSERTGSAPPASDLALPPTMSRTVSNGSLGGPSGPPSRPGTSMSNASSIDDLLGPPTAGGRKGTARGKKKGRGYVDVMSDKAIGS